MLWGLIYDKDDGQLLEYLNSGDSYQLPIHKRGMDRYLRASSFVISPTLSSSTLQKSVNDAFDTTAAAFSTLQLLAQNIRWTRWWSTISMTTASFRDTNKMNEARHNQSPKMYNIIHEALEVLGYFCTMMIFAVAWLLYFVKAEQKS